MVEREMMNKTKNRYITTILIISIIFAFIKTVFAEDENTIQNELENNAVSNRTLSLKEQQNQVKENLEQARQRLEYVEGELSTSIMQIQTLEDRIAEYQTKLDEVNSKYQDLQAKVEESQKELDAVQAEYNRKNNLLKDRLVMFYKKGTISYLDVLLNSRDILEFVSRYYIINKMTEYDSKAMEEVEQKKLVIQKKANELKEAKVNMRLAKTEAEEQTVVLQNTKTIMQNHKDSLSETEQNLQAQIDAYKKQQEELENLILYAIYGSNYEIQYSGGVMMWPTNTTSYITSPYGSRLHPIQGIIKNHAGIDIGGAMGDPVYASASGVIIYSQMNDGGYGNMVMIDHGINEEGIKIVTLYGHGSQLLKSVGDTVNKGDVIMLVGSTGNSTGPHVHFEVRENGLAVDPKKYLSGEE